MEATSQSQISSLRHVNNNASKGRNEPTSGSKKESKVDSLQNLSRQNKASRESSKKSYESTEPKSINPNRTNTNRVPTSAPPKQHSNAGDRTPADTSAGQQQQHQNPPPDTKSVLRVNLIKKSSRHMNILTLGRRPLPATKTEQTDEKPSETHLQGAKPTVSDSSDDKLDEIGDEGARKSQKLVVSLIKQISETVSKQELEKILDEINQAIKEIQLDSKQKTNVKGNNKSGSSTVAKNSHQTNKISLNTKNQNTKEVPTNNIIVTKISNDNRSDIDEASNLKNSFCIDVSSNDEASKKHVGRLSKAGGRLPDRCLRLTSSHAKFISPHRKRSLEERLSRAQEAREKFLEYKANKFRDILKKVEEMRAWKEEDTMNLEVSVQAKLQRAEAKRKEQLDKIIRKAHDEESKVSEIQFINNLMAQNRRYDMNSRKKEFESRLQDLQGERQKRFEEKQAKEVAAEERRKALEAERKAKLLEIQRQRKLKTQKVEQQQRVKENRRIETNRTREQKISAIKEAYIENVQTLKKRINKKQEQSELRHEVNLRLIRQKAFELSIKRYNYYATAGSQPHLIPSVSHQDSITTTTTTSVSESASGTSTLVADNKCPRLQLKPFNTKKFCNLCKETISSELALFSHLRSDTHYSSINEHYNNTTLTTNEAVEIHNLRHIIDTDEPLDNGDQSHQHQLPGTASAPTTSQQSSRASSLVNYYHSCNFNQVSGISMSESDRESLIAIERKCRKLRAKLIVAGKLFNRDWFENRIRHRLAQLMIQQRTLRQQTTNTDVITVANTIDLSANNTTCQHNKPFYLKITRITRELISLTTDQRISGGGLLPNGIIHSVDRLLADLNKQLVSRKVPEISLQLLLTLQATGGGVGEAADKEAAPTAASDQFGAAIKMLEFHAIDTLFLYDIISCLVSILRKIVPNVSLTSKLPSSVACHSSTLIDPVSLHSYYYNRSPVLSPRIYIKMIGLLQNLSERHGDICYMVFQSNSMIHLSDILSYRLGFIIGNQSPTSSISGSSSAATLSVQTVVKPATKTRATAKQSRRQQLKQQASYSLQQDGSAQPKQEAQVAKGEQFALCNGASLADSSGADEDEEDDCADEEQENNDEEIEQDADRLETYRRTEEIVDDMTASLCKLLASVTETILSQPLVLLNQVDRGAFYQRSDDFISYMVSVGIVDTESVIMSHIHQHQRRHHQQGCARAPTGTPASPFNSATNGKIINFSTSCIQFVSSLVKLVISKLATDTGTDDQRHEHLSAIQRDRTQLLATLKITQISDVLTLVYDMLVHFFHSLADGAHPEAEQPPAAEAGAQLGLALESLRLANYVAYIDVKLFQEMLADDEMLALQLRHVCSYLIQRLLGARSPPPPPPAAAAHLSSNLLNEIILLLGHFGYLNQANQLSLKSGRRPTIIEQLIGLPFDYFSRPPLKLVLMPTLISCAYLNDQICALLRQDLSLSMLTSFIEDQLLASQVGCAESKSSTDRAMSSHHWPLVAEELANNRLDSLRWQFERRFAKCEWLKAKKYFEDQARR